MEMIALFTSKPVDQLDRVTLGRIVQGPDGKLSKKVWTENRPPNERDLEKHLKGEQLLGLIPDKAINLDLDATPLEDLEPLADLLKALEIAAYMGKGNTRGSKVWLFFQNSPTDISSLAKGLGHLVKTLLDPEGKRPVETYPNGNKGVFLPLFGVLGEKGHPLYDTQCRPVGWPFEPTYADPEALRRLVRAIPFLVVALQRRPEGSRHETAMALLNLAHRNGLLKEVCALLATPRLFETWELGDSRNPEGWRKELEGLSEAAQSDRYERKRGLPYLQEVGFDLKPIASMLNEEDKKWPTPIPLTGEKGMEQRPFPVEALGPLKEVVEETARIVQGSDVLTAAAFLAAASLGAQGVANAIIDGRIYPASLFFFTIAESGERKTETDRVALLPARKWQENHVLSIEAEMAIWRYKNELWEDERKRILKDKRKTQEEKEEAFKTLGPPPPPPWKGRFLFSDTTTEALLKGLEEDWPSLGLFASEGGVFLGGVSMSDERRLYTIATLARLWDGQEVERSRREGGTKLLLNRRLAVHLGTQPEVAWGFLRDPLVKGQGLLARFLTAWVPPKKEARLYLQEDVSTTPSFRHYQNRLEELLNLTAQNVRVDDLAHLRGLKLRKVSLSPQAKSLYISFFNDLERRKDKYQEVRPFLSKTPEHAVRIALVLTLFENPHAEVIPAEHMDRGIVLAEWYLEEHWRLTEEVNPQAESPLIVLWLWLKEKAAQVKPLTPRYIAQYGPRKVRGSTKEVRELLKTLEEFGYLRILKENRREVVEINPLALKEKEETLGGATLAKPEEKSLRIGERERSQEVAPLNPLRLHPPAPQGEARKEETLRVESHPASSSEESPLPGQALVTTQALATVAKASRERATVFSAFGTGETTWRSESSQQRGTNPQVRLRSGEIEKHFVDRPEDIPPILPKLMAHPRLGLDLETTGLDPHRDRPRLLSLAGQGLFLVVDLFRVPLDVLAPLFGEEGPVLIGHNLKFDLLFLLKAGVWRASGKRLWDTGLAHQVLHAQARMPALKDLVVGLDKSLQTSDWNGPLSKEQLVYAALDSAVPLGLYGEQLEGARNLGLEKVLEVEHRALPAVAWMELMGVPFAPDLWQEAAREAEREAEALRAELPFGVNWNSPPQVLAYLKGEGLNLPDTREDTLAGYREHPLVSKLLRYREVAKRASTYGKEWVKHLNPATGRIHPSWQQIGAETGRMACRKPNLQQVPRDPNCRKAFQAPEGKVLLKADFSQIELRIAAAIASEEHMLRAFREGKDLHTLTASLVLGKPLEEVGKEDRQLAKALNFGLLYGLGAEGLRRYALTAYGVKLTFEEAQELRKAFFRAYPALRRWHWPQPDGEVEVRTLLGRRRTTARYTEKLNTPVQGTGADGLKLALALLWENRHRLGDAFPVLAVHDELVLESPEEGARENLETLTALMRQGMEEVLGGAVPVEVEGGIYRDWGVTPWQRQ